jgi:serine-type D-Ala-D-Ala carboxypeptidase (penicillin-binding protein 5/6)
MMKMLMRTRRSRWWYGLVIIVVASAYTAWAFSRPLPLLRPTVPFLSKAQDGNPPTPSLVWPAEQAAVGIIGGITTSHGPEDPVPTASTAKVITALTILKAKPLRLNETGPMITMTNADVTLYQNYASHGGSVVRVTAGEKLTEYQMLQAMLLPSANNIADSLAIWAFGSLPAYQQAAKTFLDQNGVTATQIGSDASGFDPSTTSNAPDLVRIGVLAMQNPVIGQVVAQPTANLPVVGTVKNVNWLLGTAHIIGLKTGNTDQAGGVFISASQIPVNNQPLTLVTAVAGAPTLQVAMADSLKLIQSAQANFPSTKVVKAGDQVGYYSFRGQKVPFAASQDLQLQVWSGKGYIRTAKLEPIRPNSLVGTKVGSEVIFPNAQVKPYLAPLELKSSFEPVPIWWRLSHPF